MIPPTFTPTPSRANFIQRGFTLVEVLTAIFILALAASGVAAMQLHALRTAQHSAYQSAALQLAIELAELLRAEAQPTSYQFEYKAAVAPSVACAGADCDLAAWKQRLTEALPRARVVVCTDSTPVLNETLRWACSGSSGDGPLLIKIGWASREPAPAAQSEPPPFLALPVER
ncbi:type IV pilus modification protein PilV [Herbaspirillum sp. NPDC101396]|uniref:type IV pilus modification protein PilV n=1 Tax=Herbaspirillum sp. NPDC101396 TaxID=3364005 RepID=UPI00383A09C7